jgi:hypothetical protein
MHDMTNNSCSTPLSAAVRLELEGRLFAQVEEYRRRQQKIPSRREAVLQLVGQGLSAAEQRNAAMA